MLALITTGVDAGLVGLVLSYALNTTSSLVGSTLFWYIHLLMFNIELGCPFSQRGRAKHRKRWAYPSSDGSRTRSSMGDTGDEACWRMANNGQNYIWVCFCVITVASLFDVFVETIPHVIVLNWIWSLGIFLWPSYVNLRTRAASSISILLSIGRRWKNWCLWKDRRWKIIGWLLFVFTCRFPKEIGSSFFSPSSGLLSLQKVQSTLILLISRRLAFMTVSRSPLIDRIGAECHAFSALSYFNCATITWSFWGDYTW